MFFSESILSVNPQETREFLPLLILLVVLFRKAVLESLFIEI